MDLGSGRLLGDDIGILAGPDSMDLHPISGGDLGSGRSGGDDVDPFAEDVTAFEHDDGDDFGLEAKLDELADEALEDPMDHDAVANNGGDGGI